MAVVARAWLRGLARIWDMRCCRQLWRGVGAALAGPAGAKADRTGQVAAGAIATTARTGDLKFSAQAIA